MNAQNLFHPSRGQVARIVGAAGAALLLLAITGLYLEPGFVVSVANQLWSCF